MIAGGSLKVRIAKKYPLAEAPQAHRDMEARKLAGKTVKDYLSAPDAVANIHAKTLNLKKLAALGSGKREPEGVPKKKEVRKKEEKKPEKGESDLMKKLKASGQIVVDTAKYEDHTIKDFRLNYQYAKGVLKVDPMGLQFSAGGSFTADGSLNGSPTPFCRCACRSWDTRSPPSWAPGCSPGSCA